MKRKLCLLLALILVLATTGCGTNNSSGPADNTEQQSESKTSEVDTTNSESESESDSGESEGVGTNENKSYEDMSLLEEWYMFNDEESIIAASMQGKWNVGDTNKGSYFVNENILYKINAFTGDIEKIAQFNEQITSFNYSPGLDYDTVIVFSNNGTYCVSADIPQYETEYESSIKNFPLKNDECYIESSYNDEIYTVFKINNNDLHRHFIKYTNNTYTELETTEEKPIMSYYHAWGEVVNGNYKDHYTLIERKDIKILDNTVYVIDENNELYYITGLRNYERDSDDLQSALCKKVSTVSNVNSIIKRLGNLSPIYSKLNDDNHLYVCTIGQEFLKDDDDIEICFKLPEGLHSTNVVEIVKSSWFTTEKYVFRFDNNEVYCTEKIDIQKGGTFELIKHEGLSQMAAESILKGIYGTDLSDDIFFALTDNGVIYYTEIY